MKKFRSGMALLLTALLLIPSVPVSAEESDADVQTSSISQITFNTGDREISVVDPPDETAEESDDQTVCFNEDGSYTIAIPEENPFFPYEVQFKCNGETTNEWFMNPSDSVEVAGHTFYVDASYTDDKAVSSITLNVGGHDVAVYPDEKKFVNGASEVEVPAEQATVVPGPFDTYPSTDEGVKYLTVDLSSFTPASLLNVNTNVLFADQSIADSASVVWKRYNDELEVTECGKTVNLFSRYSTSWTMYVGEADQLNSSNTHYSIYVQVNSDITNWIKPVLYTQDESGVRTAASLSYRSLYSSSMEFGSGDEITAVDKNMLEDSSTWYIDQAKSSETLYFGYEIDPAIFNGDAYSAVKVFPGYAGSGDYQDKLANYTGVDDAYNIADQFFPADMSQTDSGINISRVSDNPQRTPVYSSSASSASVRFTVVTYDANGNINGIAPVRADIYFYYRSGSSDTVSYSMYTCSLRSADGSYVSSTYRQSSNSDGSESISILPYSGYSLDDPYKVNITISKEDASGNETFSSNSDSGINIKAAFAGDRYYDSIADATASGATDIKDQFIRYYENYPDGYLADYKNGVKFTVFMGEDEEADRGIFKLTITINENYYSSSTSFSLSSIGTIDENQTYNRVPSYMVGNMTDSYGEYNYWTLLVDSDADLSKVAFDFSSGAKVYAAGSSAPLESRKSTVDLSSGNIQLTMSAEDGSNSRNVWLHVVRMQDGEVPLYINSLSASESSSYTGDDGVIRTTREVMVDSFHDNVHDIVFVNPGTADYENITATLESDTLQLDSFYGFNGTYPLRGYGGANSLSSYNNEVPQNVAKIRLGAKDGVTGGAVSGTLTISSDDKTLMIITLTGVVGDPQILTDSISDSVKFVPYGTMIQNSNKYSWITTSYSLWPSDGGEYNWDGIIYNGLPDGMMLKPNGELYGVPKETGTFTFQVTMNYSGTYNWQGYNSSFSRLSSKTYTLVVKENTDENVDNATDTGYELSTRISSIDTNDSASAYFLVSQGTFDQFIDFYLDGRKLTAGTDYNAESGSTRITIMAQTLRNAGSGTHTLAIEFRDSAQELKKAAQNVNVAPKDSDDSDSSDDSGDSDSSDDSNNSDSSDNSGNSGDSGNSNNSDTPAQPVNTTDAVNPSIVTDIPAIATNDIYYIVQRGDTLSSISLKIYGNADFWPLIYENNKNIIKNPNSIYAGMVLAIKTYFPVTTPSATDTPVPEAVPVIPSAPSGTYTVKAGDCLFDIAKQVYGNGNLWRMIYEANQDKLKSPQTIYTGQVLVIPER